MAYEFEFNLVVIGVRSAGRRAARIATQGEERMTVAETAGSGWEVGQTRLNWTNV